MSRRDPRVDAYIAQAAPFAQPILARLREIFLGADPRIAETIKWGIPHYEFEGIVCSMAAFKKHVSYGFWKATAIPDPLGIFSGDPKASMAGHKVATVEELPSAEQLAPYLRAAIELNERGEKAPPSKAAASRAKAPLDVPPDLAAALAANAAAKATFDAFPPSHRREYLEWITEAKKPDTRARRIAQAVEMMAEGKSRNWKYEKC